MIIPSLLKITGDVRDYDMVRCKSTQRQRFDKNPLNLIQADGIVGAVISLGRRGDP